MRIRSLLVVVCALLLTGGCSSKKDTFKIGAVFALTGPAAMLGTPEGNTTEMIVNRVNEAGGIKGRPLEVIFYDTEADSTKALTAVKKLISKDNVLVIIGPTTSGTTLAVADFAEKSGVPLVSCASSYRIVSPLREYVFKVTHSDDLIVKRIYEALKSQGISAVAILTASDGFGDSGREQLKLQAEGYGITIVSEERFGPGDTDMTTQLTKIKGTDAAALICWGTNPGPAIIAKNMRQLGMSLPVYNSHGVASKKFIELAGDASEGIMLPVGKILVADQIPDSDPQKGVLMEYRDTYEKEFSEPVSTFGGHAWDAMKIVVSAMESLLEDGEDVTRETLKDRIEETEGLPGVAGIYKLSDTEHNGLKMDGLVMVEVKNGDWKLISQ